jgi:hypothetical protein
MLKYYTVKTYTIGLFFTLFSYAISNAQVGIGNTNPNSNALLEVGDGTDTGGVLLPRVSLTATNNPSPLTVDVAGMIVYNTNDTRPSANAVSPGFFYNDGTDWIKLGENDDWKLLGNAGTSAGTNFVGTTDATDLVIKTNNLERLRAKVSETVLNEDGDDTDFRVESDDQENMIFVNAAEDQVFIRNTAHHIPSYIDPFNVYANSIDDGTATIGIQYAIAGWNQGTLGGGVNAVIQDTTNPYAAIEGSTEGPGIAVRGLITSTTSAAIATSGTSNDSNSFGVYGSVPTSGTWTGYGGIFTGGLAYANGVYNVSDSRAKRDIEVINSTFALDKILSINGYTYKYDLKKFNPKSAEDAKTYYGFMAQNVKEFLPYAVAMKKVPFRNEFIKARSTRENSVKDELINVVDYTAIVPVLVEAMKEQQAQIESLKNRIKNLEK